MRCIGSPSPARVRRPRLPGFFLAVLPASWQALGAFSVLRLDSPTTPDWQQSLIKRRSASQ